MNDELIVGLNLNLPLSKAKAVLDFLQQIDGAKTSTQAAPEPARPNGEFDMLMSGEKSSLVVRTFIKHGGRLFNKELATALGMQSKPQLTFKPLATITLRLRKMGVPDKDWYQRERVNGNTLLRLRSDVADLFKRAAESAESSQAS